MYAIFYKVLFCVSWCVEGPVKLEIDIFALLALFILSFQIASSTEVFVERGHKYDKIIWDGDCSKTSGIHVAIDNEKMRECKQPINKNSIKLELLGSVFSDKDCFVKCYYDDREPC